MPNAQKESSIHLYKGTQQLNINVAGETSYNKSQFCLRRKPYGLNAPAPRCLNLEQGMP